MTRNVQSRFSILWAILMILVLLPVAGCAGSAKPAEAARATVSDAASGIAGVVAHTESAQRHVEQAIPHSDDTGKVHLVAATDEHQAIIVDAAQTRQALETTSTQITLLEGQVVEAQADYSQLESRWFVRWGQWIERVLWIMGITWLALGAASVALGLGNPLSLTWRIGKEITRMVPLMNPFSWIRDWILARRTPGIDQLSAPPTSLNLSGAGASGGGGGVSGASGGGGGASGGGGVISG